MKIPRQQALMAVYMAVVLCAAIAVMVYIKHHPAPSMR
jgi:hypothetical protein